MASKTTSHPDDAGVEPLTACPEMVGRGERIRTSGLYVPNVALYQAKLHPDDQYDDVACDADGY